MRKLLDWLGDNKAGVSIFAIVLAVTVFGATGCIKIKDFIHVRVPFEMQKAFGVPGKIPLADAERVVAAWAIAGKQFAENIEGGYVMLGAVESILGLALNYGGALLPGIGGILIAGLGGILIKGPGTATEKQKSYNKGRADMEDTLLPLLKEAGINIAPPTTQ